jgi:hypothetical protein
LADGSRAYDGWKALAQYDTNQDGKIDVQDDVFNQLLVWQDANGNGVTDDGELLTLAQRGITSIQISTDASNIVQNGNELHGFSTYTTEDGAVHEVVDAWLQTQSPSPAGLTLSNGESVQMSTALSTAAAPYAFVDMSSDLAANLLSLTLEDVLAAPINGTHHQLTVMGDANDRVSLDTSAWTHAGNTVAHNGHSYAVYNNAASDTAQLLIAEGVTLVSSYAAIDWEGLDLSLSDLLQDTSDTFAMDTEGSAGDAPPSVLPSNEPAQVFYLEEPKASSLSLEQQLLQSSQVI